MQSRLIVDAQKESLLSTHKVLRNTYFFTGINNGFFSGCCVYFNELKLALSKYYCVTSGFMAYFFLTNKLADRPAGIFGCLCFSLIYGIHHRANFKYVVARNGRFDYACIRRNCYRIFLRVPLMY